MKRARLEFNHPAGPQLPRILRVCKDFLPTSILTRSHQMKALALLFLALSAHAIERDGTLSDDDKATLKTCTAANPCAVWSEGEIRAILVLYRQRLIESGTTCKRDSI